MYIKDGVRFIENRNDLYITANDYKGTLQICPNVEVIDGWFYNFDSTGNTYTLYGDISHWDFSNIKVMKNSFTSKLDLFDGVGMIGSWDFSNLESIESSFCDCSGPLDHPHLNIIKELNFPKLRTAIDSFVDIDIVGLDVKNNVHTPVIEHMSGCFSMLKHSKITIDYED